MLLRARLRVVIAVVPCLVVAACTSTTSGEPPSKPSGALAMGFESEPYPCVDACPNPRRALAESEVHVVARAIGAEAAEPPVARSTDNAVAAIQTQSVDCSCNVGSAITLVDASRACDAPATKECVYSIRVQTHGAGDMRIEMATPRGDRVVDFFALSVREAVKISPVVEATGPKQTRPGRSLVFLGQPITITPFPEDADHQRLVHHEPVTTVSSSDPAVVAVNVDATSGARATAMALGSATLSIAVGAASANVGVDVVVQ